MNDCTRHRQHILGDNKEGIGQGQHMLSFVPLHQSAIKQYPPLINWVKSWVRPPRSNGLLEEMGTMAVTMMRKDNGGQTSVLAALPGYLHQKLLMFP